MLNIYSIIIILIGVFIYYQQSYYSDQQIVIRKLCYAAYTGNIEIIENIVKNNNITKINFAEWHDSFNNTALHWAAKGAQFDSAKYLIKEFNADVLATNTGGTTALHWSCSNTSSSRVLDLLLDFSSDTSINIANDEGETPLHWCIYWQNLNGIKVLINRGADVNVKDNSDNTPLHNIPQDCNDKDICRKIVKLMLKNGASITAINKLEKTPLHYFRMDKNI